MSTIGSTTRPTYIYDSSSDTWVPIGPGVHSHSDYSLTTHTHTGYATLTGTETLTNKTINLTNNTFSGTTAQFNTALSDGDFATLSGTETLANKTLTTPTINVAINQQSSSYTLVAADASKLVEISSTGTVTIPTDASVAFETGTQIHIAQTSSGQVTIAGASGVTVNGTPGLKLRTQWSMATLIKRSSNNWIVSGDLIA